MRMGRNSDLAFERFFQYVETYRELEKYEFQEFAGFSPQEVSEFEDEFQKYDRDGGGSLSIKELLPLLQGLGKESKSVSQQQELKRAMEDNAPTKERDPDKEDDEESGEEEAEINFKGFLQLMRRFLDDSDAEALRKEE